VIRNRSSSRAISQVEAYRLRNFYPFVLFVGNFGNMLGFHRRTRSLIPVKDLVKYDKLQMHDEGEMDLQIQEGDFDITSKATATARRRQRTLIYVIFLAEA
jgi:hypothetical protein